MGFSQNAIGFYLELQDTLSPALSKAEKNYGKFVKKLDSWNTKAFQSATRGMAGVARAVTGALSGLTAPKAGRSSMRVSVEFSKTSQRLLGTTVARAVAAALRKATFSGQKGAIKIPKFAKGGIVGGKPVSGGGPPKDNIQALVSEGERILSVKEYQKADEALGRMRSDKGQFLPKGAGKEIDKFKRGFDGLASSLDDLADAHELGLDPDAMTKYTVQLEKLDAVYSDFHKQVLNMSVMEQKKHIPQLKAMNAQMKSLRENVSKAAGPLEKLFGKIIGPARFLAISTALENLQENFLEISNASQNLAGDLELGASVDGLVTNFMQMNSVLRLSDDALDSMRDRFTAMNKQVPLAARDSAVLSESLQQLIQSGIGQEKGEALYLNMGLLAKAGKMAVDELTPLAHLMANDMKMSVDDIGSSFATFAAKAAAAQIPVNNLTDNMKTAMEGNRAFFSSLSPQEAKTVSDSFATILAASEQTKAGLGAQMATLLDGLSDPDKLKALSGAFEGGAEGLMQALKGGDMSAIFRGLGNMDAFAQTKVGEAFGLDPAVVASLVYDTQKLSENTARIGKVSVSSADSVGYLGKAIEGNQTTFQRLKESMTNLITNTFPNVIAFFGDLNPLALLSAAYLLKTFNVFSLFGKLGPMFTKLGPRIATALLPLASGGVATGLGVGLGAGLTALGTAAAAAALPLTLIVAAIAAVVAVIIYFRKELAAFFDGVWTGFIESISPLMDEFAPLIADFKVLANLVGGWLTTAFEYWFGALSDGAGSSASTLTMLVNAGKAVGKVLAWLVKVAFTPLVFMAKFLHGAFTAIVSLFNGDVSGAVTAVSDAFAGMYKWVFSLLGLDYDMVMEGLVSSLTWVGEKAVGFVDYLIALPGKVAAVFSDVGNTIRDALFLAIDAVTAKFTAMIDWAQGKWSSVKEFFGFGDAAAAPLAPTTPKAPQPRYMDYGMLGKSGMANGGFVTGGSGHRVDDVLAMLAKGEMVVPAATTAKLSQDAANPLVAYPMLSKGSIDSVSTPTLGGDNRTMEVLNAMLAVMKEQLQATRNNAPIASPAGHRQGSGLARQMAGGSF